MGPETIHCFPAVRTESIRILKSVLRLSDFSDLRSFEPTCVTTIDSAGLLWIMCGSTELMWDTWAPG